MNVVVAVKVRLGDGNRSYGNRSAVLLKRANNLGVLIVEKTESRLRKTVDWIAFGVSDGDIGEHDPGVGLKGVPRLLRCRGVGLRRARIGR